MMFSATFASALGLTALRISKTRKVPLAPLVRPSRPLSIHPDPRVRLHRVAAPYHVPRSLHYEYAQCPPTRRVFPGPGCSLSVSTAPPSCMLPTPLIDPSLLDGAFAHIREAADVDNMKMDAEPAVGSVLASGTEPDFGIHGALCPDEAHTVDVEMEDLEVRPNNLLLLDEITSRIASLSLQDEVDEVTVDFAALTLDEVSAAQMDALVAGVAGLSLGSPTSKESASQCWAPPLPIAEPDVWQYAPDVEMADVDDDLEYDTRSIVMMDVDEPSPDNGLTQPTYFEDDSMAGLVLGHRVLEAPVVDLDVEMTDVWQYAPSIGVDVEMTDVDMADEEMADVEMTDMEMIDAWDDPRVDGSEWSPAPMPFGIGTGDNLPFVEIDVDCAALRFAATCDELRSDACSEVTLADGDDGADPLGASLFVEGDRVDNDEDWSGTTPMPSPGAEEEISERQLWSDEEEVYLNDIVVEAAFREASAPDGEWNTVPPADLDEDEDSPPSSPTPCNGDAGDLRLRKRTRLSRRMYVVDDHASVFLEEGRDYNEDWNGRTSMHSPGGAEEISERQLWSDEDEVYLNDLVVEAAFREASAPDGEWNTVPPADPDEDEDSPPSSPTPCNGDTGDVRLRKRARLS